MKRHSSWLPVLLLGIIIIAAGYLRLGNLDHATMGSDRMEFYKTARSGISPWALMTNSADYLASMAPFWFAAHNLFLQAFRLEADFANVRMVDAITGILVVLAMYGVGTRIGGRWFGLLAAVFTALHPFSVLMSRECYFYVPVVLGCVLSLWSIVMLADYREDRVSPGPGFLLLAWGGFILTTYTTHASWVFAAIAGILLYWYVIQHAIKGRMSWTKVGCLSAGFAVLGLPLLFNKTWGATAALSMFAGDAAEYWGNVFGKKIMPEQILDYLAVFKGYLFGSGWVRGSLNVLVLALAGWNVSYCWKSERGVRAFSVLAAAVFISVLAAHARSVHMVNSRHFASLLPFFVVLVCLGCRQLVTLIRARILHVNRFDSLVWMFCMVGVSACFLQPALWAMNLDGDPPYRRISQWVDGNLAEGTVVLCDRWFAPWNEFQVNSAKHVFYTFTIPNEPPEVYLANRWRDSAMAFLRNNPFAAYYDGKQYWTRIGPWVEPYAQFSQKQEFVDHANQRLATIGLAYHGPLRPGISGLTPVSAIYYNTDADVIDRARREGRKTLRGFGEGWRYLKPWQPMQGWPEQLMQALWIQAGMYADGGKTVASLADLQKMPQQQAVQYLNQGRWTDYRIPGERSPLRLFNLTETELQATLTVTGIALSGNVRCMIGDQAVVFPQTLLVERRVPITLKPGENEVVVSLPANQFMLVHDVRVNPADGAP